MDRKKIERGSLHMNTGAINSVQLRQSPGNYNYFNETLSDLKIDMPDILCL